MKKTFKPMLALSIFAIIASTASCKKETGTSSTTSTKACTSTLHAYTSSISYMDTSCTYGIVNPTTATISSTGLLMSSTLYSNQAAYNYNDGCYYVLKASNSSSLSFGSLYKINGSGATTMYSPAASSGTYSSLTYNKVTNKLYCANGGHLVEINITGSTFTTTNIVAPVHPFYVSLTTGGLTVDNNTGDMYFVTGNTSTYYIEKYHLSDTATTVVASGTSASEILGMRYNENDNMLYAIRENYVAGGASTTEDFIKINPSAGSISTIKALSLRYNPEFFSACIDPCSNRYILSSGMVISGARNAILEQLNMSGTVLQHDALTSPFMGLDVQQTPL